MADLLSAPRGRNPAQPWESGPGPLAREIELWPGLFARAWGEAGPLVLAVHGWRGRPLQFLPIATGLLERGHRVVALDLPGHGRSAGRTVTPDRLGRLIVQVVDRIGPVSGIIGHSFGGAAIGPALLHGLAVARVVIIASPSRISGLHRTQARALALPPRALMELDRLLEDQAGRPARELDLVAALPDRAVQGLIVHDRDDAVVPCSESQALAAAWPQARLLLTDGLGHRDVLAERSVIETAVNFIAGDTW